MEVKHSLHPMRTAAKDIYAVLNRCLESERDMNRKMGPRLRSPVGSWRRSVGWSVDAEAYGDHPSRD
jgi:hypothetical protein